MKRKFSAFLSGLLVLATLLSLIGGTLAIGVDANAFPADFFGAFQPQKTYVPGQFTDVPENAWYGQYMITAYELGLMNGSGAATFNPTGNMTLGEVVALACRMRSQYIGDQAVAQA